MLDAGRGGGSENVDSCDHVQPGSRRQYTLKGVEAEVLDLMRNAARKEGMKIGSWVSLRMKEAAQRALEAETARNERVRTDEHQSVPLLVEKLYEAFALYRRESDERLARIESEILDINSSQRAIMVNLLMQQRATTSK